jgi:anti-sigma-K factor RskA
MTIEGSERLWFRAGSRGANQDNAMKNTSLRDHIAIVGQLPDYVLGKLDETSLRRVTRHLEVCETCRHEATNAMVVLGLLAPEPPPAGAHAAILRRASEVRPVSDHSAPGVESATVAPAGTAGFTLISERRRKQWSWSWPAASRAVAAAAVVLVAGVLGWSYEQRNGGLTEERLYAMMSEQVTAYPLDDSDLSESAAGVVFAEPESREVYIVANGLPVLPQNQRYQVWLFTADDQQESAGLLTVGADGGLRAVLETPEPFADYVGVALTAEPLAGSDVPTSDLVLGGSFPPVIAAVGSSQF